MSSSIEGLKQSLPVLAPKLPPFSLVEHLEAVAAQMKPATEETVEAPQPPTSAGTTPTMHKPPHTTPVTLQPSHFDPRVTSRLPSTLVRPLPQIEGESKNPYTPFFSHQNCATQWEFYNVLCEVQFIMNCQEQRLLAMEAELAEAKKPQESKVMYHFNPPTPTAMDP
ncbi:hypothetical protein CABS03_01680 [Colletotrichum abscissum]